MDHDHLMHITPNDLPIDNLISQSLTAIWCLGINSESFLTELNYSGPVLSSAALEHVLNNPLSKRDLFQDLNSIKHLLAQN